MLFFISSFSVSFWLFICFDVVYIVHGCSFQKNTKINAMSKNITVARCVKRWRCYSACIITWVKVKGERERERTISRQRLLRENLIKLRKTKRNNKAKSMVHHGKSVHASEKNMVEIERENNNAGKYEK